MLISGKKYILMELNGSNIIQMVLQSEQDLPLLQAPALNQKIISARTKNRLIHMEINTSYGSFMEINIGMKRKSPLCPSNLSTSMPRR
jgi:hypothetical protein